MIVWCDITSGLHRIYSRDSDLAKYKKVQITRKFLKKTPAQLILYKEKVIDEKPFQTWPKWYLITIIIKNKIEQTK